MDPVSSWFPSQNSSEEEPKQSSSELLAAVAPAAQNSLLAAFPVSPPTSEPSISAGKKTSAKLGNVGKVRARSPITVEDMEDGQGLSKRRRVGDEAPSEKRTSVSVTNKKEKETLRPTVENDVGIRSTNLVGESYDYIVSGPNP